MHAMHLLDDILLMASRLRKAQGGKPNEPRTAFAEATCAEAIGHQHRVLMS